MHIYFQTSQREHCIWAITNSQISNQIPWHSDRLSVCLKCDLWVESITMTKSKYITWALLSEQCGIYCGAIDEPSKSSKAIDKCIIINFCNKNVVIARFHDKNDGFILFIYICMTHSQMLGKVEYGWGPIFKVVLEC